MHTRLLSFGKRIFLILVLASCLTGLRYAPAQAATITVTNNDDSGAGSLRQAIADASNGDTITFAGDYTIALSSQLAITKNLTIVGTGHSVILNGHGATRVFYVPSGSFLSLNSMTVANGISHDPGGGGHNSFGGGIESLGTLTVTACTFIGNYASYRGGGIYSESGNLTVINSTFSGNQANTIGGGLSKHSGSFTMTNSTFSGNTASSGSSIHQAFASVTVNNSLFAGNTGNNCSNVSATASNNLADDSSCGTGFIVSASINLDALGSYGGPTQTMALRQGSSAIDATSSNCPATDQRGVARPQGTACDIGAYELVPQAATATATTEAASAVSYNSAALNGTVNAKNTAIAVSFQYGLTTAYGLTAAAVPAAPTGDVSTPVSAAITGLAPNTTYHYRVLVAATDGAIAAGSDMTFDTLCGPAAVVTAAADSGAGSLRKAITDTCDNGTITFGGDYTITLASELAISKSLTIDGAGHSVTVSGSNAVRVFTVAAGVTFTLSSLTVAGGNAGDNNMGGGIYSDGTVNVTDVTFSGNSAGKSGGGIASYPGSTLSAAGCTFTGNGAAFGGGLFTAGTATVTNCTFYNNTAGYGGGFENAGTGTATVTNCSFASNNSGLGASGIANDGASVVAANSFLAGNPSSSNCSGTITGNNNLATDDTCGTGFTVAAAILHAGLGDYGGPTQTLPLLPGSAAIDAGDNATCTATDQRGVSRVDACDVGAFESQGFALAISGGNSQSTQISAAFAAPLSVTVTANNAAEPVDGGQVTFTPPASGPSAVIIGSPAAIASAAASVTATANDTTGGPYAVAGSAAGATSVDFNLTNLSTTTTSTSASTTSTSTTSTSSSSTTSTRSSSTSTTSTRRAATTTTTASVISTTTTAGPTTTTTSVKAGPCPAQKVLGEDHPLLEQLRDFRDSKLAQSAVGRKLIHIYYNNAEAVNGAFDRNPALQAAARRVLEHIAPMLGRKE